MDQGSGTLGDQTANTVQRGRVGLKGMDTRGREVAARTRDGVDRRSTRGQKTTTFKLITVLAVSLIQLLGIEVPRGGMLLFQDKTNWVWITTGASKAVGETSCHDISSPNRGIALLLFFPYDYRLTDFSEVATLPSALLPARDMGCTHLSNEALFSKSSAYNG